jgi:hypothetical protein
VRLGASLLRNLLKSEVDNDAVIFLSEKLVSLLFLGLRVFL